MALSMDEQRILDEIERRLCAEDPGLAARLSSFKRPGPAAKITARNVIIGSVLTVVAALVLSLMVYAMIPFRGHVPGGMISPQATGSVSSSAKADHPPAATSSPAPASKDGPAIPHHTVSP